MVGGWRNDVKRVGYMPWIMGDILDYAFGDFLSTIDGDGLLDLSLGLA